MTHEDTEFRDATIALDGHAFVRCLFTNCRLVYSGGQPPTLDTCSFDRFTFEFDGAASLTLSFLALLYHGGFQRVVDDTFERIRHEKNSGPVNVH